MIAAGGQGLKAIENPSGHGSPQVSFESGGESEGSI